MEEQRFQDPVQVLILSVIGILFLLSGIVTVIIPLAWMEWIMTNFQSELFPALWSPSPLYNYMLRTMGGFIIWIGVTFMIAADDPSRYKWWIFASGVMLIFFSVLCAAYGLLYKLPLFFFLGDSIFSALGALLLFKSRPWRRNV